MKDLEIYHFAYLVWKSQVVILANKFGDFIGFNGSGVAIIEKENGKNSNKYILQHLLDTAVAEVVVL